MNRTENHYSGSLALAAQHDYFRTAPNEFQDLIHESYASCAMATNILNNLGLCESIQSNTFQLHKEHIPIHSWNLDDCIQSWNRVTKVKGVRVMFENVAESKGSCYALLVDIPMLETAISNVIMNAFQHSLRGDIIRVRMSGDLHGANSMDHVLIDIIGNIKNLESTHFNYMMGFDHSELIANGESSLGLSISQHIIKLHDGTIISHDGKEYDKLATISIKLPLHLFLSDVNTVPNRTKTRRAMISILLVDDSALNRKLLIRLLASIFSQSSLEYNITEVDDGSEAVKAVEVAVASKCQYDCIFLDYIMLRMNGPETASYLRKTLNYSGPIIAITGNALQEDRDNFLASGANLLLAKPVDISQLARVLKDIGIFE